jgi:DNA replication protein DnaC
MVRAVELKEAWIQDFPANEGSEETVLWRIQNVRFLFIDDLGKEYRTSSGFSETNFGSLLRERSRKQLVTSLTTNINPDNFADSYGIASYELLRECTVPVALAGTNHRDKEFLKNQALLKG